MKFFGKMCYAAESWNAESGRPSLAPGRLPLLLPGHLDWHSKAADELDSVNRLCVSSNHLHPVVVKYSWGDSYVSRTLLKGVLLLLLLPFAGECARSQSSKSG